MKSATISGTKKVDEVDEIAATSSCKNIGYGHSLQLQKRTSKEGSSTLHSVLSLRGIQSPSIDSLGFASGSLESQACCLTQKSSVSFGTCKPQYLCSKLLISSRGKAAFYAVQKGHNPGIYTTWSECEAQVKGFQGSVILPIHTHLAELLLRSFQITS
jgi:hypothetical protein